MGANSFGIGVHLFLNLRNRGVQTLLNTLNQINGLGILTINYTSMQMHH